MSLFNKKIPLKSSFEGVQNCVAKVWKDSVTCVDEGDKIASCLTEHLGIDCRLVVKDSRFIRTLEPKHCPLAKNLNYIAQVKTKNNNYHFMLKNNFISLTLIFFINFIFLKKIFNEYLIVTNT